MASIIKSSTLVTSASSAFETPKRIPRKRKLDSILTDKTKTVANATMAAATESTQRDGKCQPEKRQYNNSQKPASSSSPAVSSLPLSPASSSSSCQTVSENSSNQKPDLKDLLSRIDSCFHNHEYKAALQLANEACEIDSKSSKALLYKARALSHLNNYPDALETLNRIVPTAEVEVSVISEKIRIYTSQGNLKMASKLIEEGQQKGLNTLQFALTRISILAMQEKHHEVITACKEFIKSHPSAIMARYYRGLAYLALDMLGEAERDLTSIKEKNKGVVAGLARIQMKRGKLDEASKLFEQYISTQRRFAPHPNVMLRRQYYEAMRDYASIQSSKASEARDFQALSELYKDIIEHADDPKLLDHYRLGQCYFYMHNDAEAIKYLSAVMKQDPEYDNGGALLYRAILMCKKDLSQALADAETAIKLNLKGSANLWQMLLDNFNQALGGGTVDIDQHFRIAEIFYQRGNDVRAHLLFGDLMERAKGIDPKRYLEAHFKLCVIWFEKLCYMKSLGEIESYLKNDPNNFQLIAYRAAASVIKSKSGTQAPQYAQWKADIALLAEKKPVFLEQVTLSLKFCIDYEDKPGYKASAAFGLAEINKKK